jgi:TonB family protein
MRVLHALFVVVVGLCASAAASAPQEQVFKTGDDGVTAPRIMKDVKPVYPPAAREAKAEGLVRMDCVVKVDGTVGETRVLDSPHPALNEAALRALAEWRFVPGTKDGKPVPVQVEVEMMFTFRESEQGPSVGSAAVYKKSDGVTMPTILKEFKPRYTAQAMRDRAQGSVRLDCVVLPDGTVGDVRISQKLHPDLDEEAVRVVRQWTFKPGTKDGVAVPVPVEIEMTYTLRSGPPKLLRDR